MMLRFSNKEFTMLLCVCNEDNLCLKTGSGCLPGDKIASNLFSRRFREPIKVWSDRTKQDMMQIYCPITMQMLDVSKCMYADDLFNKIIVQGLGPDQIKTIIRNSNNVLNEELKPTSIVQNVSFTNI